MSDGSRYAVSCGTWIALFVLTLGFLADLATTNLLARGASESYGAYVTVVGFLIIMPVSLAGSSLLFYRRRSKWLFFVLAVAIAALTALVPVAFD
jgi:amino acid transporter